MRRKLAIQGIMKLIIGIVTLGLLLFLPAWTFHFPGAWRMIGVFVIVGSFFALIPMAFLPFLLAKRILNEEKVLCENLNGYEEYTKKVRYRLIPFIW